MTTEAGALSLRITETGGDQVLQKLNTIDAKARALGNATQSVKFNVPNATAVNGQLQLLGANFTKIGQAATAASPGIDKATASQDKASKSATGLTASLGAQFLTYQAVRQVFREAVALYDAATEASDRQANAHRKLSAVARLTGTSLETLTGISSDARSTFRLSAASADDLTSQFAKLSSRAGTVAQTGQLMAAWMDLGAANGLTLDETLQALTTTLSGQDEGLNKLGLMDPSQIWAKWAKAVGGTKGALSDQQKWLAIVMEVTSQGAKVNGEYEKSLGTVQGQQKTFNEKLQDTEAIFGRSLAAGRQTFYGIGVAIMDAFGKLDKFSNSLGDKVREWESKYPILAKLGRLVGDLPPEPAKDHVASFTVTQNADLSQFHPPHIETDAERKARLAAAKRAEAERVQAIDDEIATIVELAKEHALEAGDMLRAMALEKQLTKERDAGTASIHRRLQIIKELHALEAVILKPVKLSDVADIHDSAHDPKLVGVDKNGKMRVPFPEGVNISGKKTKKPLNDQIDDVLLGAKAKAGLAMDVGNAIGSALSEGMSAAFDKDSDKNFFEAFGNALLSSLGNIVMSLGSAMLTYGIIAATWSSLLAFTPFAEVTMGAGAAIAAGTGLIALGAGMGAIASRNSGHSTGGGGGGGGDKTAKPKDDQWSVAFDPDRKLRKGASAVSPSARSLDSTPMPEARPVVHIGTINSLSPDDAKWQRAVADTYNNARNRGLVRNG